MVAAVLVVLVVVVVEKKKFRLFKDGIIKMGWDGMTGLHYGLGQVTMRSCYIRIKFSHPMMIDFHFLFFVSIHAFDSTKHDTATATKLKEEEEWMNG